VYIVPWWKGPPAAPAGGVDFRFSPSCAAARPLPAALLAPTDINVRAPGGAAACTPAVGVPAATSVYSTAIGHQMRPGRASNDAPSDRSRERRFDPPC